MGTILKEKINSLPEQVEENLEKIETLETKTDSTNDDVEALTERVEAEETKSTIFDKYFSLNEDGSQIIMKLNNDTNIIDNQLFLAVGEGDPTTMSGSTFYLDKTNKKLGLLNTYGDIDVFGINQISNYCNRFNVTVSSFSVSTEVSPYITCSLGETRINTGDSSDDSQIMLSTGTGKTSISGSNGIVFDTNGGNDIISLNGGTLTSNTNSYQFKCVDSSNVTHTLMFNANTLKLTIDGNELGGSTLYEHNIRFNVANSLRVNCKILNSSSTAFTYNTLESYLQTKSIPLEATGYILYNGNMYSVIELDGISGNLYWLGFQTNTSSLNTTQQILSTAGGSFLDTVEQVE